MHVTDKVLDIVRNFLLLTIVIVLSFLVTQIYQFRFDLSTHLKEMLANADNEKLLQTHIDLAQSNRVQLRLLQMICLNTTSNIKNTNRCVTPPLDIIAVAEHDIKEKERSMKAKAKIAAPKSTATKSITVTKEPPKKEEPKKERSWWERLFNIGD